VNAFEHLVDGFGQLATPEIMVAVLVGALAGTIVGVLPGLGPLPGAALLLPLTYQLPPVASLIMITGVYVGSMYGGSTTAILLNIPGETASTITTIDGYEMTKQGRAGPALTTVAIGSFIAGTFGVLLVMLFSPVLSNVSLKFGPPEFFALTAGGLILLARVTGGSAATGMFPMMCGVLLSTIGLESETAVDRFTLGISDLSLGVDVVPVAIGLFGLAEVMLNLEAKDPIRKPVPVRLRELMPSRRDLRRSWAPWTRGSLTGFGFGLLPGPAAALASFASYRLERAVGRHRKELGTGAIEGVAGPEAANNAASVTGLVPALSLGLPFSPTYALMISAMIVQGIQPGPLLINQHPDIFWTVIAAMYVSGIVLLILNLPLVSVWVQLLRLPTYVLFPLIFVIAVVGTYTGRNNSIDLYTMLVMTAVGYILRKFDFSLASFIVGIVLGPLAEHYLRQGLFLSQGSAPYFVSTPLSIAIWALAAIAVLGGPIFRRLWRRYLKDASVDASMIDG
jgi:putative tricarboxylic transport membrane protein